MESPAWIETLKAAKRLGNHQRRQFLDLLGMRGGFWDADAKAPSDKARALGIVRPGPKPGEWEWDAAFVEALAEHCAYPGAPGPMTPARADDAFREGLHGMFKSPRETDPDRAAAREHAYRECVHYRHGPVLAWTCADRGVTVAVEMGRDALLLAMSALDLRHTAVRSGAMKARDALIAFAAIDRDHPLVRFGIVPGSDRAPDLSTLVIPPPSEGPPSTPWEQAAALARSLGFPEPAMQGEEVEVELLTVWERGQPIAVIDRCGMKWRNALASILRTGALGDSPGGDHEARAEACDFHRVRLGSVFERPVLKAVKRAPGTAPTCERTIERYRDFLRWTREDPAAHPLPPFEREAKAVVDTLAGIYRARKADGSLPASARQVAYANDLAQRHGLDERFDATATQKDVAAVIERLREAEASAGPGL